MAVEGFGICLAKDAARAALPKRSSDGSRIGSFERPDRTVSRASDARNRYKIRYARTQHRPASRQVSDHGRVSGTHRLVAWADRHTSRESRAWAVEAYIAKRTAEGKTLREAQRCLKRYIARQIYRLLQHPKINT